MKNEKLMIILVLGIIFASGAMFSVNNTGSPIPCTGNDADGYVCSKTWTTGQMGPTQEDVGLFAKAAVATSRPFTCVLTTVPSQAITRKCFGDLQSEWLTAPADCSDTNYCGWANLPSAAYVPVVAVTPTLWGGFGTGNSFNGDMTFTITIEGTGEASPPAPPGGSPGGGDAPAQSTTEITGTEQAEETTETPLGQYQILGLGVLVLVVISFVGKDFFK